jgi:tetratricopeptide (TPR) repeat protein
VGGAVPFSLRRFAATLLGALALVPVLAAPASEDLLRPCRSESGESLSAACQAAVAGAPFDSLARAVPAWLGERRHAHALRVLDEALRRPALDALTRQRLLELRSLAEEQAWSEGRRAPSSATGDAEWVLAQARCTRLSGAAGLAACEQALRLRPEDASTLAARGDHLFTLGRAAEAEETYRAAAARDPALRLEQKIASAHALRAPAATPSGEPAAAADALPAIAFGRYHALVIGNDAYRHLPACARRCTMPAPSAELLRSRYGFAVTLLTDATRADIVEALDELPRTPAAVNDNLLIYYAGHGWLDNRGRQGLLATGRTRARTSARSGSPTTPCATRCARSRPSMCWWWPTAASRAR